MNATAETASAGRALTSGAVFAATALLIVALAVGVYWPGLAGPFLFDDFDSIARLGDLGGVDDWDTFRAFVLGGSAGPTGRPLALITFLIDGNTWPTDAWPFKRSNLVIHIFAGLCLFLASYQILRVLDYRAADARWIALAAAALWLVHPFLVSTTLYAVQRMAQLAALFTFAGLAVYLHARRQLATRPRLAYAGMTIGVLGCTVLATLSKENGALLPLLVGILELTVLARRRACTGRPHPAWYAAVLVLPAAVVVGYLVTYAARIGLTTTNLTRGYSIYERLLTEARVLADYLLHWFLPSASTSGVFQDHVQPSTSLMEPATTLPALLLHALLIGVAVAVRKRWPATAFAILFFYGAHLLESTVINLELYFEHRNYLAAGFLFLPPVMLLAGALERRAAAAAIVAVTGVFAAVTAYSSSIWSSYPSIVEAAARTTPGSARAQEQYALLLFNSGNAEAAIETIDTAIERLPENDGLRLTQAIVLCRDGSFDRDGFTALVQTLGNRPYDPRLFRSYETFLATVDNGHCPQVRTADLSRLFAAMLSVPANADAKRPRFFQIRYFLGVIALKADDTEAAAAHLRASFESRPSISRAMLMASLLAGAGDYERALSFTEDAMRLAAATAGDPLLSRRVSIDEITAFRERLEAEMEDASALP